MYSITIVAHSVAQYLTDKVWAHCALQGQQNCIHKTTRIIPKRNTVFPLNHTHTGRIAYQTGFYHRLLWYPFFCSLLLLTFHWGFSCSSAACWWRCHIPLCSISTLLSHLSEHLFNFKQSGWFQSFLFGFMCVHACISVRLWGHFVQVYMHVCTYLDFFCFCFFVNVCSLQCLFVKGPEDCVLCVYSIFYINWHCKNIPSLFHWDFTSVFFSSLLVVMPHSFSGLPVLFQFADPNT